MEFFLHLQPEMLTWSVLFGWPSLHACSTPGLGQLSGSLGVPRLPQGVVLSVAPHVSGPWE